MKIYDTHLVSHFFSETVLHSFLTISLHSVSSLVKVIVRKYLEPCQKYLPGDALLLQLRLVHGLALLLVDGVAGLDVVRGALGVRVRGANLNIFLYYQ